MPASHLQADRAWGELLRDVTPAKGDYQSWRQSRLRQRLEESGPTAGSWNHLISLVLISPECDADSTRLDVTLRSLLRQTYHNIEVMVVGGHLAETHLADAFAGYRGIFFEPELTHLGILRDSHADRVWRGSHLMFAWPGTVFDADAFALLNAALNAHAPNVSPDLVLCDHDRVKESEDFVEPCFTCGWDPDLIHSLDYVETAFLASRALIRRHRARSTSCTSLHDWLRLIAQHEPDLVTQHVTETVVHLPPPDVQPPPPVRSSHALVGTPELAVIVPNRNRPELLKQCLKFMDFENGFKTELIIVDNASDDPSVVALYAQLEARHGAKIASMNQRFNFARMVNVGVAVARAETFLLLNNDVEITAPGLIEQLLAHAQRPEVGVVGTKLLNGDGTVQHAGIVLEEGHAGVQTMLARHVLRGASRSDPGYLGALSCVRNYQAVTGALMAGRRGVFVEVGGFDEVHLPVEFNDVDYCLRVRRAGYRVLCLPLDGIFHLESSTRGSELSPEVARMRQAAMACMADRWREAFRHDPYRNPWVELGDVPRACFPWARDDAGAA